MPRPAVSVVVIHRNRADAIERTVAAFADQTVETRIIVVDNGQIVADGPKKDVIDALRSGRIGRAS